MFLGPVFSFELLTLARRRRYYLIRFVYGLILLLIVWKCYPSPEENVLPPGVKGNETLSIERSAMLGRAIFLGVATAQSIAVLMLTPALVAGVIADEKMRKTLHYLMASSLGSAEIILGKLGSRLITTAVYLMLALPILAILGFLGGVDPNDVFLLFLASGSTAYLLASYSVLVSVHARRPREAVTSVYLSELAWLFLPTILKYTVPWGRLGHLHLIDWARTALDWSGATSPFFVVADGGMFFRNPSAWYATVLWMVGLQVLCGSILTALAIARLRPVFRAELSGPGALSRLRSRRRLFPRPACFEDPILWKELFVARRGAVGQVVTGVVWLGVAGLIGYWTFQFAKEAINEAWTMGYFRSVDAIGHNHMNVYVRSVATLLLVCWELGVAVAASGAFGSEREGDTWTSLIVTPLSPLEIVRGKLLGAVGAAWPIAVLWLMVVVSGLLVGAVHPFGFVAGSVVAATYVGFAAALGLFYSLRCRTTSRALTATIGTMALTNGLYLLACIGSNVGTTLPFLGVTPFIAAVSLTSYREFLSLTTSIPADPFSSALGTLTTGFSSIISYGLSGCFLVYYTVTEFDDTIDRPRTFGGRRKRRHPLERKAIIEEVGVKGGSHDDL